MKTRKPSKPISMDVDICGYTKDERLVSNKLFECYELYKGLPQEHPNEITEFTYAIHLIQGLLAIRAMRRCYPKGYPTYDMRGIKR